MSKNLISTFKDSRYSWIIDTPIEESVEVQRFKVKSETGKSENFISYEIARKMIIDKNIINNREIKDGKTSDEEFITEDIYTFSSFEELKRDCDIKINTLDDASLNLRLFESKHERIFTSLMRTSQIIPPMLSIFIPFIYSEFILLFLLLLYPVAFLGSTVKKNIFSTITWIIFISLSLYFIYTGFIIGIITASLPLIMLIIQKMAKRYYVRKILEHACTDEICFKYLLATLAINVRDKYGEKVYIKKSCFSD